MPKEAPFDAIHVGAAAECMHASMDKRIAPESTRERTHHMPTNTYTNAHLYFYSLALPKALVDQLKAGGRMMIPIGLQGAEQHFTQIDRLADGHLKQQRLFSVAYVPLVKKNAF